MTLVAQIVVSATLALFASTEPPAASTVALAAEIGITPEALVVAGFSTEEAAALVDSLGTDSESRSALTTAHATIDARAATLAAAEVALRESPGNADLRAARNTARSQLRAGQAALDTLRTTIRTELLSGAGETKRNRVATFLSAAARAVPPEFKAISRSDSDWAALEAAVRAEARAIRRHAEVPSADAALLAAARANADVGAAKARIEQDLATVKATFVPQAP